MSNPVLQRGRKTTRLILLTGLVCVLLGFAASPSWAEPGDDSGGSTQGKSDSNPDGGGVDKPGCESDPRGCQGTAGDRDGNNGCGNDADREDDNNGNCGGKPAGQRSASAFASASATASGRAAAVASETETARSATRRGWMGFRRASAQAQVAGEPVVAAAVAETPTLASAAPSSEPRVLGTTFNRDSRPRSLAFTGGDLLKLALLGLAAIAAGWGIRRSGLASH